MDEKREPSDPESEFLASRASRMKGHPYLGGNTDERGGRNDVVESSSPGDYYKSDENKRKRVDEFWEEFNEQRILCSKTIAEMKDEATKCWKVTTSATAGFRDQSDAKLVSWRLCTGLL